MYCNLFTSLFLQVHCQKSVTFKIHLKKKSHNQNPQNKTIKTPPPQKNPKKPSKQTKKQKRPRHNQPSAFASPGEQCSWSTAGSANTRWTDSAVRRAALGRAPPAQPGTAGPAQPRTAALGVCGTGTAARSSQSVPRACQSPQAARREPFQLSVMTYNNLTL